MRADKQAPQECTCGCHRYPGMLHFRPCCEGQCSTCGKWFKSGLRQHNQLCAKEQQGKAERARHEA